MYLCIDIGGTAIKYGIAHVSKKTIEFIDKKEIATDAKKIKGPGIEKKIVSIVRENRKAYELEGVAISTAGVVNSVTGDIIFANDNIPDYIGINLKKRVENEFGLPCAVENDVNAAALGELAYGSGQDYEHILCLTVGTGIGGALILDGKLYHGSTYNAGEVGYMSINGRTLEEEASVSALIQRVLDQMDDKEITLDGKSIFHLARNGNAICQKEIDRMCSALAQGIVQCVCITNPQAVILGGGIMSQEDYLRPIMEQYLEKYIWNNTIGNIKLIFAVLGNDAGMAGAGYNLKQKIDDM
ncbi:ROK family protein [Anoxybacterium hadale]|uniref:ROK family protein n=1 Tax=Anoxybacterium hadale TaxID=3408580 RepID=A0ACD1AFM6_9FIRM|nr:ROK family protein [Clostridiales bacterium]